MVMYYFILINLMEKYKTIAAGAGLDYGSKLADLKWQRPFRVLDLSKTIYVELRENKLEICLKFPYQLKKSNKQILKIGLKIMLS